MSISSTADGSITISSSSRRKTYGIKADGTSELPSASNLINHNKSSSPFPASKGIGGIGLQPVSVPMVNGKFLFIGLDNAGKTTLIYQMTTGMSSRSRTGSSFMLSEVQHRTTNTAHTTTDSDLSYVPPAPAASVEVTTNRCIAKGHGILVRDAPGRPSYRHLWYRDLFEIRCIIFVVDANDRGKFPLVKSELSKIGVDQSLENMPVLVLGNKIDMPNAVRDEAELTELLDLGRYLRNGSRMWTLRLCSANDMESLANALLWGIEERVEKKVTNKPGLVRNFSERRRD